MKHLATILLLWLPISCFTQQWDAINENHEAVSFIEFLPKIYFGSNESLFVENENAFVELFYDLEVTDGIHFDDSCALVTIGSGSYSDAVYKVNLYTGVSEVSEYFYYPKVIELLNGNYYCGYNGGISKSADGISWTQVCSLQNDSVITDIFFDENKVMAIGNFNNSSFILRSEDDGPFEFIEPLLLPCHAAAYDQINHKLYVGVYNMSDSDGLYVSNDYGSTFELVRYMDSINALYVLYNNLLGIGVANHTGDYNGVYLYHTETDILSNVSGNLPNKNVCNLTIHPFMNCLNIIACTPDGAYKSCDAITGVESPEIHSQNIRIYPNPTGSDINISFILDKTHRYKLKVFNVSGKKVFEDSFTGVRGETKIISVEKLQDMASGIYFIQIERGKEIITNQKVIKY